MEKLLWTKGILKNKLVITRGNEQIGVISWNTFLNSNAMATLNGRGFLLSRDFLLSKVEIQDANGYEVLGSIMMNMFSLRSDLIINRKRFELEIKNFWQSKWSWKFNGQEIITFQSRDLFSRAKGEIDVYTANTEETEILILLGLYMRSQLAVLVLALFLIFLFVIIW